MDKNSEQFSCILFNPLKDCKYLVKDAQAFRFSGNVYSFL